MALFLTACGGGSSESSSSTSSTTEAETSSKTYYAVDGRLGFADGYADMNTNGVADSGEYVGTTQEDGSLVLDSSYSTYPIIFKAIAGVTKDADYEGTITESYEMVAPAGQTVITPFTTLAHLNNMTMEDVLAQVDPDGTLGLDLETISGDYTLVDSDLGVTTQALARSLAKALTEELADNSETTLDSYVESIVETLETQVSASSDIASDLATMVITVESNNGVMTPAVTTTTALESANDSNSEEEEDNSNSGGGVIVIPTTPSEDDDEESETPVEDEVVEEETETPVEEEEEVVEEEVEEEVEDEEESETSIGSCLLDYGYTKEITFAESLFDANKAKANLLGSETFTINTESDGGVDIKMNTSEYVVTCIVNKTTGEEYAGDARYSWYVFEHLQGIAYGDELEIHYNLDADDVGTSHISTAGNTDVLFSVHTFDGILHNGETVVIFEREKEDNSRDTQFYVKLPIVENDTEKSILKQIDYQRLDDGNLDTGTLVCKLVTGNEYLATSTILSYNTIDNMVNTFHPNQGLDSNGYLACAGLYDSIGGNFEIEFSFTFEINGLDQTVSVVLSQDNERKTANTCLIEADESMALGAPRDYSDSLLGFNSSNSACSSD